MFYKNKVFHELNTPVGESVGLEIVKFFPFLATAIQVSADIEVMQEDCWLNKKSEKVLWIADKDSSTEFNEGISA